MRGYARQKRPCNWQPRIPRTWDGLYLWAVQQLRTLCVLGMQGYTVDGVPMLVPGKERNNLIFIKAIPLGRPEKFPELLCKVTLGKKFSMVILAYRDKEEAKLIPTSQKAATILSLLIEVMEDSGLSKQLFTL